MAMTLENDGIVMAVNDGEKEVTLMYDSRTYRLEPGKTVPMPFAAACLWFGDPRASESVQSLRDSRGLVAFIPDRDTEVRRLRAKYDNQMGDERVITGAPHVSLFSIPENERIYTVLDDPQGDRVIEASTTVQEQHDLMTIVQRQQKQIELLTQAFANTQQNQQTGFSPVAPGVDREEDADRPAPEPEPSPPASEPTTMQAPPVPGIPSSPTPPVPDELMAQATTDFPQDGDVQIDSSNLDADLPQDGEGFETPSSEPPVKE